MMPYRPVCVRSAHLGAQHATPRRPNPGPDATRTPDHIRSIGEPVKICMTPRRPVMQPSPGTPSCPGPAAGTTAVSAR